MYKYLIIDAQWLLTKNLSAIRGQDYLSMGFLARLMFFSIAKVVRESLPAEKVILLFDKSPYHKCNIVDDYKGDRTYYNQEDLDKFTGDLTDPKVQSEYESLKREVFINMVKQSTKDFIIKNFCNYGMGIIYKEGYEGDDLALLVSRYLHESDPTSKSVIYSVDDDWRYLVSPNVDYANGRTFKISTYDQMVSGNVTELGTNLYLYKSVMDSAYGSHNNLCTTIKKLRKVEFKDIYKSIMSGSDEYLVSREKFEKNLKSFNIHEYPDYEEVMEMISNIHKVGRICSVDDFEYVNSMNGVTIGTSHYTNFISKLNKDLYNNDQII